LDEGTEDKCSANIDWLAYPSLVLPVKKDIPDALDGLPEWPWHDTTGENFRLPDRLIKDRRSTISLPNGVAFRFALFRLSKSVLDLRTRFEPPFEFQ
jgi:hypothetical protein